MKWMIDITYKADHQADIAKQIDAERQHVAEGQVKGLVHALYLSAPDSPTLHTWLILNGDSAEQVQTYLETYPLYPYMHTQITKLNE